MPNVSRGPTVFACALPREDFHVTLIHPLALLTLQMAASTFSPFGEKMNPPSVATEIESLAWDVDDEVGSRVDVSCSSGSLVNVMLPSARKEDMEEAFAGRCMNCSRPG